MNNSEPSGNIKGPKCELTNRTSRLVSYQGNSRKTYHIPPRSTITIDEIEIRESSMIKKLISRGVISIHDKDKSSKAKAAASSVSKESKASADDSRPEKARTTSAKPKKT